MHYGRQSDPTPVFCLLFHAEHSIRVFEIVRDVPAHLLKLKKGASKLPVRPLQHCAIQINPPAISEILSSVPV